ncbi:hypothetical protein BHM03_00038267 [Ensete ventricosum]|nr:hypothetical protein BHM03_00038267 [Ensete ventricosum]
MGHSYSREGAARLFVHYPPLVARSSGQKWLVLACFWAIFACCSGCNERSSGCGICIAGKVLPFALFTLSLVTRSGGQKRPILACFWPILACFWAVFTCYGDHGEQCETLAISAPWNPPGGLGLDGAFV